MIPGQFIIYTYNIHIKELCLNFCQYLKYIKIICLKLIDKFAIFNSIFFKFYQQFLKEIFSLLLIYFSQQFFKEFLYMSFKFSQDSVSLKLSHSKVIMHKQITLEWNIVQ